MKEYEAILLVRPSVVERCKEQHLTWAEIIGCIVFSLYMMVNV